MTGVKVSEYTELASLVGDEKIPTGTGVRKATTPDQLKAFIGSSVIAPKTNAALLFDDFLDIRTSRLTNSTTTLTGVPAAAIAAAGIDFIGAAQLRLDDTTSGANTLYSMIDPILNDAHTASMFDKIVYTTRIYIPSTKPAIGLGVGNKKYITGLYRGNFRAVGEAAMPCIAALVWSPDSAFFRLQHSTNQFVATDVTPAQDTVYLVRIEWVKSTHSLTLYIDNVQKATATLSNYDSGKSIVPLFGSVSGAWTGDTSSDIWTDYMSMAVESSADRF